MENSKNTTKIAGVPFNTTGLIVAAIIALLFLSSMSIHAVADSQELVNQLMK